MRFNFLSVLFFLAVIGCVPSQQQATIIFTSDEEIKLIIYRPIDGFFNRDFPTDTVFLQPGIEFIYQLSVAPWGVVRCRFHREGRTAYDFITTSLFIEKGGRVYVHHTKEEIEFGGDNAAINAFLHNTLSDRGGAGGEALDSLFQTERLDIFTLYRNPRWEFDRGTATGRAIDSLFQTEGFDKIEAIINNPRLLPQMTRFYEGLDSLFVKGKISSKAYSFGTRTIDYQIKFSMLNRVRLQIGRLLPMSDAVKKYISLIGESFIDDEKIVFHTWGNSLNGSYSFFLFNQLDRDKQEYLRAIFPHVTYRLLLEGMSRLSGFFAEFTFAYQRGINLFDRVAMYHLLQSEFPESEAVQIIGRLVAEDLRAAELFEPVFPANSIAGFSDLGSVDGLQNKYILVGLWASWCAPCRAQFRYSSSLRELLDSYGNVEKIYISIDENENRWKEAVSAVRASGFHLLASEELRTFLTEEVYQGGRFFVPRYLLLDAQGNILNDNLAWPSDMEDLRKQLDEHLGSRRINR